MNITIQGRLLTPEHMRWIQSLLIENPEWHRTRLSREICTAWDWMASNGQMKDMACRTMLLKLERKGYIQLPPPLKSGGGNSFNKRVSVIHSTEDILNSLRDLTPIRIEIVQDSDALKLFKHLLQEYHYLGFSGTVGQNIKYLIFDKQNRPLACMLFGSAAWQVASRDQWIGWNTLTRQSHLHLITNNMRFLILPWVKVPHLASHLLGRIARRISADWMQKYGHPIHLLETFVERDRFRGTSYQAANWHCVGQTQGRSRNDRYSTLQVPIKDVYLYPLVKNAQEVLCYET